MKDVATVGVLGAGTMGAGIAQVAAEAGIEVLLHDPVDGATDRARERIGGFLARKAEKASVSQVFAATIRPAVSHRRCPERSPYVTRCRFLVPFVAGAPQGRRCAPRNDM